MRYRKFGRLAWNVSEVGYGMFGMGSWSGSDDGESRAALQMAVNDGCNFFDSAWGYGEGRTDSLLGELVRANPAKRLYVATKVPPKNMQWPAKAGIPLEEVFPSSHVRRFVEMILDRLDLPRIDLLQFHVWQDAWGGSKDWQRVVGDLKSEGLVRGVGISINRWEPENALLTVRSGLIDSVQVIYNVFAQSPEDELFPACEEEEVAMICRVPFDEGTLTGALTVDSRWDEDDWRSTYFVPENLKESVARADALSPLVPDGMTMAQMAMRFILSNPTISTVIPGMRSANHVRENLRASDAGPLPPRLLRQLRAHRWDRAPTEWSQ